MKDSLLARVRRPVQYTDAEVNAIHKAADSGRTLFALAFPDTYELGMSHQGLKILYHVLNGREDAAAERVFAPEDDLEAQLRAAGEPLATLESGTPLARCHLLGFTLQSELHYTTILNMLDLGGVPLEAAARGPGQPFVIGGGPQALNPEPLAEFFDAFALGDGEEVVLEIAAAHRAWRNGGGPRADFLDRLAGIPGVYVPSLYRVTHGADGRVTAVEPVRPGVPPRVDRRLVSDLDLVGVPTAPPVPWLETTHDRFTVEVARGCVRGCRFCHAGMVYRPYRERSPEKVEAAIMEGLARTGYDEVSLSALSTGDYCHLAPLARRLAAILKERSVSLSLPSIRPGSLPDDVIKEVGAVRKSGFTIAPEAGTDRLRRVINKGITEEEILATAGSIFRNGWKSLKLYFMIGLPTETSEDVEGIAVLAQKIRRAAQDAGVRQPTLTVSVSSFVPKPHTPFQWCAMAPLADLKAAVDHLHKRCRQMGISFKWHHPEMSLAEGVLCRGDRRLSGVIREVWRRGGKFEAWTDRFDLARWKAALEAAGLDADFYTTRLREEGETHPWDHLGPLVSREFLAREYRRGLEGVGTEPCRVGSCRECGACPEGIREPGAGTPAAAPPAAAAAPPGEHRFGIRLRFAKTGALKYLSHLELFRAFHRAARRAGLPLAYSGGFNPHPRLSFAPPLPVGMEGEAELVDLELSAPCSADSVAGGLNGAFPEGLRITGAQYLPKGAPALFDSVAAALIRITLPDGVAVDADDLARRFEGLLSRESLVVARTTATKPKRKEVRPFILGAEVAAQGRHLDLLIRFANEGSIRAGEFLELLFPGEYPWPEPAAMSRVALYRLVDGKLQDAFQLPRPAFRR